jgi:hypothetical protein
MVFVGGDLSITNQNFIDPPSHEECALYATKVCPFLANEGGKYSDAPAKHKGQPGVEHFDIAMPPTRPRRMGLYYTTNYTATMVGMEVRIKAAAPIKVDWGQMPESEET